jgi:hypothetical protein
MNVLEYSFVLGSRFEKAAIFLSVSEEWFEEDVHIELSTSGRLVLNIADECFKTEAIEDEFLLNALENGQVDLIFINEESNKKKIFHLASSSVGVIKLNDSK